LQVEVSGAAGGDGEILITFVRAIALEPTFTG
jgi:hypothetical protein